MLWNVLSRRMPALLMTMSTLPKASTADLHDRLAALGGGHRVGVGDGLAAGGLDLVDDALGGPGVAARPVDGAAEIVDDDQRAALGQLQRVLPSEAAARARDDRHSSVETEFCHGPGRYRRIAVAAKNGSGRLERPLLEGPVVELAVGGAADGRRR